MGTEVHCKSYLPGYYLMRDLNEDLSGRSWPLYYADKTVTNGQYYNGFLPRTVTDAYPGFDKDALKQKMLEHEAIFKNQVYELHRLYRIQRNMMDEIRRNELHKHQIPIEASSSSTPLASQIQSQEARKWHMSSYPVAISVSARSSVSGTEIINSPLSCTIGNTMQASPITPENGYSSKDCEVLESRPSKVRKKLFDLQLPADEYIDSQDREQRQDNKRSDISSCLPNGNCKIASEIDCTGNASRSDSCVKSAIGLADLNEPFQVEEITDVASVDVLGRASCQGEFRGCDMSAKTIAQFPSPHKEILQSSRYGSNNGISNHIHTENKENRRDWLSDANQSGHSKSNLSYPQGLKPDKLALSPQPTHNIPNKLRQYAGDIFADPNKGDFWREGTLDGVDTAERRRDISQFNHAELVGSSRVPSAYPFVYSSDVASARNHSVTSWEKPNSSFTQKLTSVQTHPSLNSSASFSRSSSLSRQENFGNQWHLKSSSQLNPGFGSDLSKHNGFYQGSSSESKQLPTSFPSDHSFNYGSGSYFKGPNAMFSKSAKDMDLNTFCLESSSNLVAPKRGFEIIDVEKKCEDHVTIFPWLKAKPTSNNEASNTRRETNSVELSFFKSSSDQMNKTAKETDQGFSRNVESSLCSPDVGLKRNEIGDGQSNKKILGFPIFENIHTSKIESSQVSTSASLCFPQGDAETKSERRRGVIDINLEADPAIDGCSEQIALEGMILEEEIDAKVSNFRSQIDLNSCITEDEVPLAPSVASTNAKIKRLALEIDLEAPAVPELEEDFLFEEQRKPPMTSSPSPECKDIHPPDEVVKIAAGALVAISSSDPLDYTDNSVSVLSDSSITDALQWFVEVVTNCGDDLDTKLGNKERSRLGGDNEGTSSNEIDDFEVMTLNLTETKEEEYMPKPLVPDYKSFEETGASTVSNRARRGPARRGRQRKDFQRDILPGLVSLSRHEVTEDLQTFGGLMKAMGHSWSGLNRRNGGARGRRRLKIDPNPDPDPDPAPAPDSAPVVTASTICAPLMQQLNNLEMGLEDRSLTGWGKTTRRPRRQRCPAGNPPAAVTLT